VGVKGEYAKQGIVDASRKASNVPAHAFATKILWQTQTTLSELSVLRINYLLVINTCLYMHHLSYGYSKIKIRLYTSSNGNGIMFAPMCTADVNGKCFTSTNEKICEHKVNAIKLDTVGDFIVFPSRFYHRGYYRIASDMTYYTAQLFCKISDNLEAWQNVTSKVNQIIIQGCVQESWLTQLTQTQDIRNNWDTTVLCQCISACKGI